MLQAYVPAEADTIPEYYKAADGTWTATGCGWIMAAVQMGCPT